MGENFFLARCQLLFMTSSRVMTSSITCTTLTIHDTHDRVGPRILVRIEGIGESWTSKIYRIQFFNMEENYFLAHCQLLFMMSPCVMTSSITCTTLTIHDTHDRVGPRIVVRIEGIGESWTSKIYRIP